MAAHDVEPRIGLCEERVEQNGQMPGRLDRIAKRGVERVAESVRRQKLGGAVVSLAHRAEAWKVVIGVDYPPIEGEDHEPASDADSGARGRAVREAEVVQHSERGTRQPTSGRAE